MRKAQPEDRLLPTVKTVADKMTRNLTGIRSCLSLLSYEMDVQMDVDTARGRQSQPRDCTIPHTSHMLSMLPGESVSSEMLGPALIAITEPMNAVGVELSTGTPLLHRIAGKEKLIDNLVRQREADDQRREKKKGKPSCFVLSVCEQGHWVGAILRRGPNHI